MVHQGTVGAIRGRGQEGSLLQQCAFHFCQGLFCRGTLLPRDCTPHVSLCCSPLHPPPLNHKPRRFFCDACSPSLHEQERQLAEC